MNKFGIFLFRIENFLYKTYHIRQVLFKKNWKALCNGGIFFCKDCAMFSLLKAICHHQIYHRPLDEGIGFHQGPTLYIMFLYLLKIIATVLNILPSCGNAYPVSSFKLLKESSLSHSSLGTQILVTFRKCFRTYLSKTLKKSLNS